MRHFDPRVGARTCDAWGPSTLIAYSLSHTQAHSKPHENTTETYARAIALRAVPQNVITERS